MPLSFWRPVGGWFHDQLGLRYFGLSNLPENFVYNAGNGVVFRRLTSTFLSPLATSYLLVVALFFVPLRRRWGPPLALLLFVALLWTHTRSALLALVGGLVLLAIVRRSWRPLLYAVVVAAIGFAFVKSYDHIGPRTHFTQAELTQQEQNAKQHSGVSNEPTAVNEASTSEHWQALRDGVRTVVHHPWGFGLGNSGVTAVRTHVTLKAGESTYTELGVEVGVLGALVFIAWSLSLLRVTLLRRPWLGAAFAAVLFLGLADGRDRRPVDRDHRLGSRRRFRLAGKNDPEGGAGAVFRLDANAPAVAGDDRLGDCEAEAGAGDRPGGRPLARKNRWKSGEFVAGCPCRCRRR